MAAASIGKRWQLRRRSRRPTADRCGRFRVGRIPVRLHQRGLNTALSGLRLRWAGQPLARVVRSNDAVLGRFRKACTDRGRSVRIPDRTNGRLRRRYGGLTSGSTSDPTKPPSSSRSRSTSGPSANLPPPSRLPESRSAREVGSTLVLAQQTQTRASSIWIARLSVCRRAARRGMTRASRACACSAASNRSRKNAATPAGTAALDALARDTRYGLRRLYEIGVSHPRRC